MSSSRATIAAATSPPRVIATIASNGPASARRQASARESRWNWSHETGKAFSAGCCTRCPLIRAPVLAEVEDEIEPAEQAVVGLGKPHVELATIEPVGAVERLVGEIELRREHGPARRLHLHVDGAGAPLACARDDGAQGEAAGLVGEQMPAQAEAAVVVAALVVRLPYVDERARDRPARSAHDEAGHVERAAGEAGLAQVGALRRGRLEERAGGLAPGRLVAIVAGGGGWRGGLCGGGGGGGGRGRRGG